MFGYTNEEAAKIIRNAINNSGRGPVTINTPIGYLHIWNANNKGNRFNTTIIRSSSMIRASRSSNQQEVFATVKCNFWNGKAFISHANAEKLV